MAEASKCDVVGCGEFSEGPPPARFILGGVTKGMCKRHADALVESFFPDLKPEEPKQPEADQGTPSPSKADKEKDEAPKA